MLAVRPNLCRTASADLISETVHLFIFPLSRIDRNLRGIHADTVY